MHVQSNQPQKVAASWEALLDLVLDDTELGHARIAPQRERVRQAATVILELVDELRAGHVSDDGVATAHRLLTDGSGPVFNRHHTGSLREELAVVTDEKVDTLRGRPRSGSRR